MALDTNVKFRNFLLHKIKVFFSVITQFYNFVSVKLGYVSRYGYEPNLNEITEKMKTPVYFLRKLLFILKLFRWSRLKTLSFR